MKKTVMAIAASLMMSISLMAQNNAQDNGRDQRPMDKDAMIKQRTEQMVKDYNLTEEQAAKLLELNTEYADKMPPMMGRGFRQGPNGGRPGAGPRNQHRPDSMPQAGQRRQRPDSLPQMGQRGPRGERPQMDREQMRKDMEAYRQSLKEIMTSEQYAKYEENMSQRMGRGQGRNGQGRNRRN